MCQCPSVPHQCHISVHLSCLSMSPISASQCHPSVQPTSASSSVPPISVHQCSLSVPITASSLAHIS
ncbi:unnamed protein product, partial [Staurois parvus]